MLSGWLNLAYVAVLVVAAPVLVWRRLAQGKYRDGWSQKLLGGAPRQHPERPCLWIHAVSVGEVLQVPPLVKSLRTRGFDQHEMVVTVTTSTGFAVARDKLPDCTVHYSPLDFSWAVRRTLRAWRPAQLILIELELWPNLVMLARAMGVRVAIVNGRLGERSFQGYARLPWLLSRVLASVDRAFVQNETYAARFRALGMPADRVMVTGNIKYDGVATDRTNAKTRQLREQFRLSHDGLVFVAGSTQPSEEAAAVVAWRAAREKHPTLQLVVVPRHKERFDAVAAELVAMGCHVVRRSQPQADINARSQHTDTVYLLDTLGELGACWGLADVAFVGGSLTQRGGQNMLEPAAYGSAVMFGPNICNFQEIVDALLAKDAARMVADGDALSQQLIQWLDDATERRRIGETARAFVLRQAGALDRTVEGLVRLADSNAEHRPGDESQRTAA